MGGSNVTLKEGKQLSELKKKLYLEIYIYIYIEYLVTFLQNMSEEKEFKIDRVKSRYNAHNLPIDVALRTQNKSPVSLKSTVNELCL